ncbi:MAG: sulfatase-like hydrolase/transferase [Prolixibacteraceae bacterium]|nr:sulfatase-like hydrolase/transferase [Prolixibacteraceae bacterium]
MNFNFSDFLNLSVAGIMIFFSGCRETTTQNSQTGGNPNIIVILPDDLGWADIGYHGSDIKTPNLDNLAKSGVIFTQHYSMATCTPTRVSLMTGKYPSRYGITAPAYGEVIDLGDPTLASVLRDNGYRTYIAGKWHMGSPPYTPLKYGFQSSYGYFDGQIDPYTHEYKTENEQTDRRSWHRNDEYLDEEGHVTDLLTEEALRVIGESDNTPFFLYLTFHVPHYPLDEPEEWMSVYDNVPVMHPSRKLFAASVTHMDAGIGKIVEALERTGKRENTLILFVSDNGGQKSWSSDTEYRGEYADKPHIVLGNNYPLRGWKGDLYEGGIRVPALINWPSELKPGVVDKPVHISNWLPTLSALTGSEDNAPRMKTDGRNIWPLITGEQPDLETGPVYWKTPQSWAVRDGRLKLIVDRRSEEAELFDLEEDFRESKDLSEDHPQELGHMLELLKEFMKDDRERN